MILSSFHVFATSIFLTLQEAAGSSVITVHTQCSLEVLSQQEIPKCPFGEENKFSL